MTELTHIYGLHAVHAVIARSPERIQRLTVQSERRDQRVKALIALAKKHHIKVERLSKRDMDARCKEAHQGVYAECTPACAYSEQDIEEIIDKKDGPALLLLLDGVQDPHNLGACLRVADAAGVDCVVAPKDRSVGLTPTVRKVASGAAETVPFIAVTNLARTIESLQAMGVWLYGASDDATQSLYEIELTGKVAFVLGAEGAGLRRLTRDKCDYLVSIPMLGSVSSLNVSVAAGICLYEAVRQRMS